MIDLNTVKPGIVHFDFGDCVRSATNSAGEDAEDLKQSCLDLPLSKRYPRISARGGSFLAEIESRCYPYR
jgi:hypothetical protein